MTPEEFSKRVALAQDFAQHKLPRIVGPTAVAHFKKGFQKDQEGFTDEVLEKWPDLNPRYQETKRRKNGSLPPILTGVDGAANSGNLGDSITWAKDGNDVVIYTDVPYAQRHNEGLHGMPRRQFMGPSKVLDEKIIAKIEKELDRIFR